MMIGSTTWVSWNPSMFTFTGSITRRSSPTLKAWMTMSTTSWPLSAKKEIQPVSRIGMMSLWSFQMLIGPETARLAMIITIGSRMADVIGMTSLMNRSPWELVAVTTRAPVAEAPMAELRAECSDSTVMKEASTRPSATMSDRCSATWD